MVMGNIARIIIKKQKRLWWGNGFANNQSTREVCTLDVKY